MTLSIRLIESPGGLGGENQYLMSYRINRRIAIDLGSLGFQGTPQEQSEVRHVLISHSHVDHIASLPLFVENTRHIADRPLDIYCNQATADCLYADVFNDRIAPGDWIGRDGPVRITTIADGDVVTVEGVSFKAVAVDHVVPTLGFIVNGESSAVVIASDTGPTERIWQEACRTKNVKAVFLEATFPDEFTWLAEVSKHLTPSLLTREIAKLPSDLLVIAVHVKARFYNEVARELTELRSPRLVLGEVGKEYSF